MDPMLSHTARSWRAAAGPLRADHATATLLATAVVSGMGGSSAGVASRAIRILQLRLAARALRLRRPVESEGVAAEWSALGALVAQLLLVGRCRLTPGFRS